MNVHGGKSAGVRIGGGVSTLYLPCIYLVIPGVFIVCLGSAPHPPHMHTLPPHRWESLHCSTCPEPKLLSFSGRPKQYSPKARLLNFLGYKLPFDRHDWIVDRCGTPVRYVL